MTILLVGHGETAGNAARILQRADVPLNERSIRQAEQLARRLCNHGFVHIVCSDLLRARMTAARSAIAVEESPLLRERNFGDLRGLPYAELTDMKIRFVLTLCRPTANTGRHFTRASRMHSISS